MDAHIGGLELWVPADAVALITEGRNQRALALLRDLVGVNPDPVNDASLDAHEFTAGAR